MTIIKDKIKEGNFSFAEEIKAIYYFYVFPTLCNAGLYAGKMYSEGTPEVIQVFPQSNLFLPNSTEVDTEINSILPLNKASENLQLKLIR